MFMYSINLLARMTPNNTKKTLLSSQIRCFSYKSKTKIPQKKEITFAKLKNDANRKKREDRIKAQLKKAADTVREHNTKYPHSPIEISDVELNIQTPSHKRRVLMRAQLREALETGDTEHVPLLINFMKELHNKTNSTEDHILLKKDGFNAVANDIVKKDEEYLQKLQVQEPKIEETPRKVAKSIFGNVKPQEARPSTPDYNNLIPNSFGLGLQSNIFTEQGLMANDFSQMGVDPALGGLAGKAGKAQSYAYNNNEEDVNDRVTNIISSRKHRLIQHVAQTASEVLETKQKTGHVGKVEYKEHSVNKYEVAELKRQLRGQGGKDALKKLIKAKSKEISPVGFIDLRDLDFSITKVTVSSDLAHATIHWMAPCLLPLPEVDQTKLNNPTGTLLEAVVKGMTGEAKYVANNRLEYVNYKNDMKPLNSNQNKDLNEIISNYQKKKTQIDDNDNTPQYNNFDAENVIDEHSSTTNLKEVMNSREIIYFEGKQAFKRSVDGTITPSTLGHPNLWRKRKVFQGGSYIGGTIDPMSPVDMTHSQVDSGKNLNVGISTKSLVSSNNVTSHNRASNVVIKLATRYLETAIPSIRWNLGNKLQIKYVPNVRFEFDSHYARMRVRNQSIASALQEFYHNVDKENEAIHNMRQEVDNYDEDTLVDRASKLRGSAMILRNKMSADLIDEDRFASKILKSTTDRRTKAAQMLNLPEDELADLTEADLDMFFKSQNMFKRMNKVKEEDIPGIMAGAGSSSKVSDIPRNMAKKRTNVPIGEHVTGPVKVSSIGNAETANMVDDMLTRGILAMGQSDNYNSKSSKNMGVMSYSPDDYDEDEDDWDDEDNDDDWNSENEGEDEDDDWDSEDEDDDDWDSDDENDEPKKTTTTNN